MDFREYQQKARETAIYPGVGNNLWYPALGLAGEAGEVAEIIKKVYRDQSGTLDTYATSKLLKELGDVLWYVAALCSEAGLNMGYVVEENCRKLQSRKERGVLHGNGSNR